MYTRQYSRTLTPPPGYHGTSVRPPEPQRPQTGAPIGHAVPLSAVPEEDLSPSRPAGTEETGILRFPQEENGPDVLTHGDPPRPAREENGIPRFPHERRETFSEPPAARTSVSPFPPLPMLSSLAEDDLLLLALLFLLLNGREDAVKENGDMILLLGFLFLVGWRRDVVSDV